MKRIRCLAVLIGVVIATSAVSWGAVSISVSFGPPALPVYVQPACPAPGYIWVPGYWAWSPDADNYYWVPGTWVLPPQVGVLWTPGYWGFSAGLYYWHPGRWGARVGFYGGINYGFGYPGTGYHGGEWRGRDFYYNRAVNNVNITNVHNVYNQTVVNNVTVNRVAYNGGPGGVRARPTSAQLAAERGRHMDATPVQMHNEQSARSDRSQFVSANQGRPAVMATPKPGALNSPEAVRASLPAAHRSANANVTANAGLGPRPPQNEQQMRKQQTMPRSQQSTPPEQSAHNVPYLPSHHAQANVPESTQRAENHAQSHVSQPPSHVTNAPPQGSQPQAHEKNAQPRH